jgi:hypothetical protein
VAGRIDRIDRNISGFTGWFVIFLFRKIFTGIIREILWSICVIRGKKVGINPQAAFDIHGAH